MFVLFKEGNTHYVGSTNRPFLTDMSKKDMLLSENMTISKIKGRKGWYMVFGRFNVTTDLIRYTQNLFAKEITYQSLLQHTIPWMKKVLSERDLVRDKYWYNELLIVNKDKAYIIDGYFCLREAVNYDLVDARSEIARGSIEFNKDLPTKLRILEAFQSVEEMRNKSCFPATLLNVGTGKSETWYSYEDGLKKVEEGAI
jgi:hypothetical protein